MESSQATGARNRVIAAISTLNTEAEHFGYCAQDYLRLRVEKNKEKFVGSVTRVLRAVFAMLVYLCSTFSPKKAPGSLRGVVFTSISARSHLLKLIDRTRIHFQQDDYSILQFYADVPTSKSHRAAAPLRASHARLRDFLCLPRVLALVSRLVFRERAYFSRGYRALIWVELSVIVTRAMVDFRAYQRLLQADRVASVVVEYDHNARVCPLVLAAKTVKVRSFTFQHGVLNDIEGYCPVLADKIFVWGQHYRDILIRAGVPGHKIVITGSQIAETPAPVPSETSKVKIIFASNPYRRAIRESLFATVAQSFKALDSSKFELVVKKHPSDDMSYGWPNEGIEAVADKTTLASIPWCDALICHNTTMALDAVRLGKLLIMLDVVDMPLNDALQELVQQGGAIHVTSAAALSAALQDLTDGAALNQRFREEGHRLAKNFIAMEGEDAGKIAAEAILSP